MKITQLHTNCRECTFATYSGKTQTDCELGRIEAYRDSGAEIVEAYDDDDKEFFVINDRLCVYHRDKEWAKHYSKSELINIVNAQTKIPYHLIIVYPKNGVLEELQKTVDSLKIQFNPPTIVSIVNWSSGSSLYEDNMAIEGVLSSNEGSFEWRIQNILNSDVSVRNAIDLTIDGTYYKYNYPFYLVFNSGFVVPEEFSKELHEAILTKGLQMIFGHPVNEDLDAMLVNKMMHRKHTGNAFYVNVEDKIKEFEENAEQFFFNMEDVCPSLK